MRTLATTPRARGHRGFTLIELVVVVVLIGILCAWVFGRITGASDGSDNVEAKTTADGAITTIVQAYETNGGSGQYVPTDGTGCTTPSSTGPRQQMDRASGTNTAVNTPLTPGTGYDTPNPTDPAGNTTPTNCPVFANPTDLHNLNGDLTLVAGTVASTGPTTASVAARLTSAGWVSGVAVLAPTGVNAGVGTCWIVTRTWPRAGVNNASSSEAYFTAEQPPGASTALNCSGNAALAYTLDSFCLTPHAVPTDPNSALLPPYGKSWNRPCPTYIS